MVGGWMDEQRDRWMERQEGVKDGGIWRMETERERESCWVMTWKYRVLSTALTAG